MRQLTPQFILDKQKLGEKSGEFKAVALFVDTSGFTELTSRLATYGNLGIEVLSEILDAVFEPLIKSVFKHGGFITGFAGDAFKAVFPIELNQPYQRGLAAANDILHHVSENQTHDTVLGQFEFSVRVSLADGAVQWGIWASKSDSGIQTHTYEFSGEAIDLAILGEDYADGGEVVITESVFQQVKETFNRVVEAETVKSKGGRFLKIQELLPNLSPPLAHLLNFSEKKDEQNANLVSQEAALLFYPRALLDMTIQGEFRPVYSVFVNVEKLPKPDENDPFIQIFFNLLNRYGGYLCRLGRVGAKDLGGTFLLFWGAPTSYENDLERVCRFLIELKEQSHIKFRAGVTGGTSYAGFVGSEICEEYTCHGSSVNQAARQMTAAEWGEIWLDHATAVKVAPYFTTSKVGELYFKGISEKQVVYLLLKQLPKSRVETFHNAYVGREQEINQLTGSISSIFADRFGGLIFISGEAGIGKSHLIYEVKQRIKTLYPQTSNYWFTCNADEILRRSLNPFRAFLRNYFQQESEDNEWENKKRFAEKIYQLIGKTSGEFGQRLNRGRIFLGSLVDLFWEDSLYEQLDPALRFENTQAALKTFLLAHAAIQPTILEIEDIHWLDQDSLNLLNSFFINADEYPFVVITSSREQPPKNLLQATERKLVLVLNQLPTVNVAKMAASMFSRSPSKSLVELLVERSNGNPFFIEQILFFIEENNLAFVDENNNIAVTQGQMNSLPTNVQSILIARLDRLSQSVKQVVQTASILGREFNVFILSQMLKGDGGIVDQIKTAEEEAIWSTLDEIRYIFRHALLREAAYQMQLQSHLKNW